MTLSSMTVPLIGVQPYLGTVGNADRPVLQSASHWVPWGIGQQSFSFFPVPLLPAPVQSSVITVCPFWIFFLVQGTFRTMAFWYITHMDTKVKAIIPIMLYRLACTGLWHCAWLSPVDFTSSLSRPAEPSVTVIKMRTRGGLQEWTDIMTFGNFSQF